MAAAATAPPVSCRPVTTPTLHIRPTAELAERVLLPGDPGRALLLAQSLLEQPRMLNHHRGLWGYTGAAADGDLLSIQSTGMGGPSAAIVVEELIRLGARRFVRVGTCGALDSGLALGELVVVNRALAADGTSRALGAGETVAADPALTAGLLRAAQADGGPARAATAVSTDVFYDDDPSRAAAWTAAGAVAVEMEAATVMHVAHLRGARAACVLAVSDLLDGGRRHIGDDALEAAALRLGAVAAAALAAG